VRTLNFAHREKINRHLARVGGRRNIPLEYGYKFPMDSLAEVRTLEDTINKNCKRDAAGNLRFKRLELVNIFILHY
jgi:hypothetical protein